jgi:hypothetical protein
VNDKSIEGYHCAQVFFGITSKMLYVAGMKTELEFDDVYSAVLENLLFHLYSKGSMKI